MSETGQLIQPEDFIHFKGFRYYKCCGWYFYLIKIDWCWYGFCLCSSVILSITFWLDWIVPFYCKNNFSVIIKNLYFQVSGNENGRILEVLRSALWKKLHFFITIDEFFMLQLICFVISINVIIDANDFEFIKLPKWIEWGIILN